MKKLSFCLLATSLFSLSVAIAQSDSSGVYLTANDFLHGKLSYTIGCKADRESKTGVLLDNKQVVVKQSGETARIDKKSIYAIKYCGGNIVRMYNGGCYPILNPGENILLYGVMETPVSKGKPMTRKYYFSRGANADIEDLTLDNLRAAFTDNKIFQDAVDNQLRTDNDLYAYDNFHKMYKLNRIYNSCDK